MDVFIITKVNEVNSKYSDALHALRLEKKKEKLNEAKVYLANPSAVIYYFDSNLYFYDTYQKQYAPFGVRCFKYGLGEHKRNFYFNNIKKFVESKIEAEKLLNEWKSKLLEVFNGGEPLKKDSVVEYYDEFFFSWRERFEDFNRCYSNMATPIVPSALPTLNNVIEFNVPSQEMVGFLFQLSDGDIKNVEKLAKLSYNIVYNPTENLSIAILADKTIHESLKAYFELLFENYFDGIFKSLEWNTFNDLYLKENRTKLQSNVFSRTPPVTLIKDGCIYKTGKRYSYFEKLLNGKVLKYSTDDFDEEFSVRNSIPVVYVTDNEENFRAMKNLYGSTGIEIHSNKLDVFESGSENARWLLNEFMAIGKEGKKADRKIIKTYKLDPLDLVEEFLAEYCFFRKNKWTSKEDLHEAYKRFMECYYPKENPLTKIVLSKKIKKIKCTQVDDGERPRQKNKKNNSKRPRGLSGIAINSKFYEEFGDIFADTLDNIGNEKKVDASKSSINDLKTFEALINSLVDITYDSMILNTRPVVETIDLTEVNNRFVVVDVDEPLPANARRAIRAEDTQADLVINLNDDSNTSVDEPLPANARRAIRAEDVKADLVINLNDDSNTSVDEPLPANARRAIRAEDTKAELDIDSYADDNTDDEYLPANARKAIRADANQEGAVIASPDSSKPKDAMPTSENASKVINTIYNYKKTDKSTT